MGLTYWSPGPSLLVSASALVLAVLVRILFWRRSNKMFSSLPPGPPGEPILGHLRIIPTDNPEYYYQDLSKEFKSDILSFNVLGQSIIVLNSAEMAVDLLDRRGANYCDRPSFVLFKIMGFDKVLTFLRWGPEFRLHRRVLQKNFQKGNIVQYRPLQERETAILLKGIVNKAKPWETVLRRFATAVVMGIGFGVKVDDDENPFIQMAADASYALGHGGAPAGTPVDYFPALQYLPRCFHDRSLRFAADWRWAIRNIHDKPYEAVVASDERSPSLVRAMLDQREAQLEEGDSCDITLDDIKGAGAATYAAGQDTTWSTLVVFVLNMLLHPEIQDKARKLLDEVVGRNRLPTFEDRVRLGYIDRIVQETLRWCPVSPIGLPHKSLQDDVFQGYFIPAGSLVYANARAMTHDDRVYHDPDIFDPDRYLPAGEGGHGEPYPNGQFGFGRRVCVGKHLGEASVWIVAACMLSTVKIEKAKDANGKEIEPEVRLTNGLTSHPVLFPCNIVPRDTTATSIINIESN